MCDDNGIIKETMTCATDEWCTGSATKESTVSLSETNTLCEKGKLESSEPVYFIPNHLRDPDLFRMSDFYHISVKVSCGKGDLFPSCNLCPENNDTETNSWCRGNCFFDIKDEICKEGNILLLYII